MTAGPEGDALLRGGGVWTVIEISRIQCIEVDEVFGGDRAARSSRGGEMVRVAHVDILVT